MITTIVLVTWLVSAALLLGTIIGWVAGNLVIHYLETRARRSADAAWQEAWRLPRR